VAVFPDGRAQYVEVGVGRDRHHVGPGNHHVPCDDVVEVEHPLYHVDLAGVDVSFITRAAQDHPYLPLRERLLGFGGRRHAEQARKPVCSPVEHDQPRQEEVVEQLHRRCHQHAETFGARDGDGLGCEFAKDHVQERDDAEPDGDRDQVQRAGGEDRREHGLDQRRDGGFADPAQSQRGDGDAQLRRREVVVEIVQRRPEGAGAGSAPFDHLVDRCRPHADECELGGDEKPVECDQKQRREQPARREQEVRHQSPSPACQASAPESATRSSIAASFETARLAVRAARRSPTTSNSPVVRSA